MRPPLEQDVPVLCLYLGTANQKNQFRVDNCHSLSHNSQRAWSFLIRKDKAKDFSRKYRSLSVLFPGQDPCMWLHYKIVYFSVGIELGWAKEVLSKYLGKEQSEGTDEVY